MVWLVTLLVISQGEAPVLGGSSSIDAMVYLRGPRQAEGRRTP